MGDEELVCKRPCWLWPLGADVWLWLWSGEEGRRRVRGNVACMEKGETGVVGVCGIGCTSRLALPPLMLLLLLRLLPSPVPKRLGRGVVLLLSSNSLCSEIVSPMSTQEKLNDSSSGRRSGEARRAE